MIPTSSGIRTVRRWAAVGLLLWPLLSFADARLEARRHFRNGMSLIAAGQFDRGIAELREAYAIKPHPNVLYNIARAYLDAGRVVDAQEYYRRYLAFDPPDAEQVRSTLARLDESTAAKHEEPKERPPPPRDRSPGTVVASVPSGAGAALDAEAVKRLNALMGRLEAAVAKAEALNGARGEEKKAGEGTSVAQPANQVLGEEAAEGVPYEETVVTASRRAQTTLEAPNAMAVITAEEIRLSGATTLVDVLRRVPGAEVMAMGVGSADVSLRGFNQRIANKVLVLLDGRTEYQDFLGLTVWSAIPVGLDEIDRIEVIRGPGSALYGANAMLGVINIITRAPGTGTPTELNVTGGMGNTALASFIHSASQGNLRYRVSAAFDQEDKWSRDLADDRPDYEPGFAETNLGLRSARANLTTLYTFNRDFSISASAGVNRLQTEIYPLGLLRNFYFDGLSAYAKTDVAAGPVKLKLFWNHLAATAGHQYDPIGERKVDSSPESNVFNAETLWQHQLNLAGEHQLNVGAEARLKRVAWTYLTELRQEWHFAGFLQDEWTLARPIRLVASYRVDRHPLLDNGKPGLNHSPRISAVWMPFEGHAFRAGFAQAFREPTFLESYTHLRIPVPGVPGASALTDGSTTLKPEMLTAFELGYRGEFPEAGLEWDLTGYLNNITNLIALSAVQRLPADETFDPVTQTFLLGRSRFQNEPGTYTARGVEIGARYAPVDGLSLVGSGAFQVVTVEGAPAGYQCVPCSQAPAFKGYLGATYRSKVGFDFALDGAYTSRTAWVERETSRVDPTQIDFVSYPLAAYFVVNARVAYRFASDKITVALVGTNLVPGAQGDYHQEHPFGNFITRRLFGTLTVTP